MDELWNILKSKLQNLSKNLKDRSIERLSGPNTLKAKKAQKGHKEWTVNPQGMEEGIDQEHKLLERWKTVGKERELP